MPNHVANKIVFFATSKRTQEIVRHVFVDGEFDFNTLMSAPANIYQGTLGEADDEDFKSCTWLEWNLANWGTKWNAYNSSYTTSNGVTEILFHTAWSPPFPVIVAFANTFKIDFEHRYCEGSQSFWGIEQWKYDPKEEDCIRIKCRKSERDDLKDLCLELMGYDIDKEEDEDDE